MPKKERKGKRGGGKALKDNKAMSSTLTWKDVVVVVNIVITSDSIDKH